MTRKPDVIRGRKNTQTRESIDDRVIRLESRLDDGFARIGEAMDHGIAVDNWEQAWVRLLREYETLQDELAAA